MHEASLAGGVLQLVEASALNEGFSRVRLLRLEVGALARVDSDALRFALESLAPGTVLEGAEVEIQTPAGTALCRGCGQGVTITRWGEACPACGGYALTVTTGTSLRVLDLLVHEP